mmetsp:Transcript_5369/g.12965  ORF Transcript_5369/g.12965 Transcript_5369/m.12965 type:complete len:127 (-) Transcript_5369:134-514(-)
MGNNVCCEPNTGNTAKLVESTPVSNSVATDEDPKRYEEFEVILERTGPETKVGLMMYNQFGEECVRISEIREGRLAHAWNLTHPGQEVTTNHAIVEVNGAREADSMLSFFEDPREHVLVMRVRNGV